MPVFPARASVCASDAQCTVAHAHSDAYIDAAPDAQFHFDPSALRRNSDAGMPSVLGLSMTLSKLIVSVVLSISLGLVVAPLAYADDEVQERDPWADHFMLNANTLGPLGYFGVEGEYAPIRQIGIDLGAGYHQDGVRVALMTRGRYILGHSALGLGVGISGGRDDEATDFSFGGRQTLPIAYIGEWLYEFRTTVNAELAFEYRAPSHLFFRISAGAAHSVAALSTTPTCHDGTCYAASETFFPYVSFAIGAAF